MNKIVQIVLINVQYHKKLVINLTNGFNAITGNNNKGKSTIIRALNWVLTNSPRGDWMRKRTKTDKTLTSTVKVIFDDKQVVKRVKGKDVNYYVVNGEEFHDFSRTGIPKEVLEVFGLDERLAKTIGVTANIDMQDEQPFLVYDKTTTKAVAINLLTGANDIEDTIKSYNKDRLECSRNIGFNNKIIKENREQLNKYKILDDIDLEPIDKKMDRLIGMNMDLKNLLSLKGEYREYTKTIKEYSVLNEMYKDILAVEKDIDVLESLDVDLVRLTTFSDRLSEIGTLEQPPEVDFDDLLDKVQVLDKKGLKVLDLQSLKFEYAEHTREIKDTKGLKDKLYKQFKGKMCPTCNGKGKL